jgi:hypothetical protein
MLIDTAVKFYPGALRISFPERRFQNACAEDIELEVDLLASHLSGAQHHFDPLGSFDPADVQKAWFCRRRDVSGCYQKFIRV